VGKGSTFTLELPRAPRMDPADRPSMELSDGEPQDRADSEDPSEARTEGEREYHDA
jgi:hypothetical protein